MKTILKNIMLFAAGALTLGFTACEEDGQDLNFNIQPGNELYAPADNASVNLDQGLNTSFEWAPSVAEDGGYITYEVLFDKADGDFSAPLAIKNSQMTGSKASLSISAKELNEVAALAGIENAKTGQIKWTVRAGKGLFAQTYTQANVLTVTRINLVDPLPTAVTLKGEAVETPEGLNMQTPAVLNGTAAATGVFDCFTRITNDELIITDDLGRYYELKSNGKVKYLADATEPYANTISGGLCWFQIDFTSMTWSINTIAQIELQASSNDVLGGNGLDGCEWKMFFTMTYEGKGVWALENYENKMSAKKDGSAIVAGDSRHKFKMTMDDGSVYYWGTTLSLGSSYTTDYLKCHLWTEAQVGNADWDKSYNFLSGDCGRALDCYLRLNTDNPAGTYYHEYIFK